MSTNPVGFTPTTVASSTSSAGINSLSSSDFMKLMLTQLEQQDPLNPTDSNQMLSQLSQISTLQANNAMQTSLQSLTLQQSIGAGGNLMGKSITGLNTTGANVSGNVTSVQVVNQSVYLGLDNGSTVAMSNVTGITVPAPSPVPVTTAAPVAPAAGNKAVSSIANVLTSVLGA